MTRASVISIDVPTQSHFFNQTALETLRPLMFSQFVSSFRAEDKPEKSDCRGGTPEILQEM